MSGSRRRSKMNDTKRIILAITGATGMLYVSALLELLNRHHVEIYGIISRAGVQVLDLELGISPSDLHGIGRWLDVKDFSAPVASGSFPHHGMIVLPCTMGTLGAIASGAGRNLIHRAADVTLKERRPLLLAVRETPFSKIHLLNMLSVHENGGIICPAMPSFYLRPETLQDMARAYAVRLCDLLGLHVDTSLRWQGMG